MSAILVKTAKAKKTFTDGHGRKREVIDATPFRTDAATAAGLLERGGFRLARDRVVPAAPLAGAATGEGADPGELPGDVDVPGPIEAGDPGAAGEPSPGDHPDEALDAE